MGTVESFRWVPLHVAAAAFPGVWWNGRPREAHAARVIRSPREAMDRLGAWEFPEGDGPDGLGEE